MMQSQQQAPFFRPPQASSHFFSLEGLTRPPSQQQQKQQGQRQTSYFRSAQTTRQKEPAVREGPSQQAQQCGGDRLSALHSRLQQEAEKIRKWKNATEVEIKQKDHRLQEAQRTVETQRKTVTELQIQNETLTSRLQDEVANQLEIQRKIQATRDLCSALKDHVLRVEEAVTQGEFDRQQFCQLNEERLQQVQDLSGRFHQLGIEASQKHSQLMEELTEERNREVSLEEQAEQLQQQLTAAHNKISTLEDSCREQETQIADLSAQLEESRQLCAQLREKESSLASEVQSLSVRVECEERRVCVLEGELGACRNRLASREAELETAKALMREKEASFHQRCSEYELALAETREQCARVTRERGELVECVGRLERERGEEREQLVAEIERLKTTLWNNEESFRQRCTELEGLLSSECSRSRELEGECGRLAAVREEGEREKKELHARISQAEHTITQTTEHYEQLLSEEREKVVEWKNRCEGVEGEQGRLEGQTTALHSRLETLEQQLRSQQEREQTMSEQLRSQREKEQAMTEQLRSQREKEQAISDQLKSQREKEQAMTEQLRSQQEREQAISDQLRSQREREQAISEQLSREKADLELSLAGVREENRALAERLRESEGLQEECSRLKEVEASLQRQCCDLESGVSSEQARLSEAERRVGELGGVVEEMKGEREALNEQLNSQAVQNKQLNKELTSLRAELSQCSSVCSDEVGRHKAEAEASREELREAKKAFDSQVDELCAMLERYRAENEKVVSQKDKEIETIRQKLDLSEKDKESGVGEVCELRGRVSSLEEELRAKEEEMKELLKAVEATQNKPSCVVMATPRGSSHLPPSTLLSPTRRTASPHYTSTMALSPIPHKTQETAPVPSTPKLSSGSGPVMSTPRTKAPPILSTPQRMYNYRVSSTPRARPTRPLPHTPRHPSSTPRLKKFRGEGVREGEEGEELRQFRELYPGTEEDEETFRRPKAKTVSSIRRAPTSSTSVAGRGGRGGGGGNTKHSTRRPLGSHNPASSRRAPPHQGGGRRGGRGRGRGGKTVEDFSWFELDSVYGFGPND